MSINETNHQDGHDAADSDTFNDEPMVPLGVGGFEQDGSEPFGAIEETKRKRLNSGTLILGGVVVLAVVGLYSMRSLAIARAGGATDETLESTIETFLSSITGDNQQQQQGERVVTASGEDAGQVLVDDRTELQVPLEQVQKNPFIQFGGDKPETPEETADATDDNAAKLAEARRKAKEAFERSAEMLRVLMIMGGSDPMANVSGRIVHVGDTILVERSNITFEVVEIRPGTITIAAEEPSLDFRHEIELRLFRNQ